VAMDVEVDQAMARDLVQHMVQKGDARIDALAAGAIQINGRAHAGLLGVAGNVSSTHVRLGCLWILNGTRRWRRALADLPHERAWRQCVRASERRPGTP